MQIFTVIEMPVVLNTSETWRITKQMEQRLEVFENGVLRQKYACSTGSWGLGHFGRGHLGRGHYCRGHLGRGHFGPLIKRILYS